MAGQGGDDVRVVDGEDQAGITAIVTINRLGAGNFPKKE
jgi:hypothetical protein